MNESRHRLATEIFDRALSRPEGGERERFIVERCGGDGELLDDVESLLAAHAAAGDFLEAPPHHEASMLISRRLASMMVGRRLGNWEIERLIHTGGMGAVYLARRIAGDFEQQAALKVIRTEFAHADVLERFTRERQVLARLEHPNIARLLDGGATEDGLPYLVMEYVPGETIERWSDARRLGIRARLELFERACAAVQYAHRHLIIHRDIKPGNILVTGDGTPKLLDFGIAKLLQSDNASPEATVTQRRMLTPGYASPEQFTGRPITTASDVYSLGALLYRLLTGRIPFEFDDAPSPAETERRITTRMPAPPSAAVSETGVDALPRLKDLDLNGLRRTLRGDLDTIVLKALRKEPDRRYESPAALAEDLERYRTGLPVRARPDTLRYRMRKFTRRHWKGLAATAGAFAALAVGLGVALWQTGQARAERDRTQQINDFLQTVLVEADPFEAGADTTVRDVLRKADDMIAERFTGEPDLEATLRFTIGNTQLSLMELDGAERNLARADRLNHALYGPNDVRSLQSRAHLAWLAFKKGELENAETLYREVVDTLVPEHPWDFRATAVNDLGVVLADMQREREAIGYFERSLDISLAHDPDHQDVPVAYTNIGYAWHGIGELDRAEENYLRAIESLRRQYPDGQHPDIAFAINNLGILMRDQDRREEALPLYEESLAIRRATLGDMHPATGMGHYNLGRLLLEMERVEDARPHLQAALDISRAGLEEEQLQTLIARAAAARLAYLDGDAQAAGRELTAVREAMERIQAPERQVQHVVEWLAEARETVTESAEP